ncbi:HAD-IA family hydrolase [Mesorhizobium sp.]|uniref:HAD-IA family hydrolase n=1 Tax=Mesorhizobium sp. TaxID=1871066 RepID=UPI0025E41627|nr:HAD-IA family hydrolase [Mesorhizobium sp.]
MSFDVVGTLIDFETAIIDGLSDIASKAGIEVDGEEVLVAYREARLLPGAVRCPDDLGRCYSVMAARFGLPDTAELQDSMIEAVAEAKPFPDSVEALRRLAGKYKLVAMTNARRWGFDRYEKKLGSPFWASFTCDETGTEKPDPRFFHHMLDFVASDGGAIGDVIHTAQSQYHDIGISRSLGMTNVWIERRFDRSGFGGTFVPEQLTRPDYHYRSMRELAQAVENAF